MVIRSNLYLVMSLRGAKRRSNLYRLVQFGGRLLRFARNDNKRRNVKARGPVMQQHSLGKLAPVSRMSLGGGGLGMMRGETTFEECVATVQAAVEAGISLLDLAPRYGDGKAEEVVGAAFVGRLPDGVRVTSKCNLGEPAPGEIEGILRR